MLFNKIDLEKANIQDLDAKVRSMEAFLDGKETDICLETLLSLQDEKGSFALIDPEGIPNEAVIDFINKPSYLGSACLMQVYLQGNTNLAEHLEKGLCFADQTGLRGHGYQSDEGLIEHLNIFIKGGLQTFLEKEKELCPAFHKRIHNILYQYQKKLVAGENVLGLWGEDYTEKWAKILEDLTPKRKYYLAYGSNMNKKQMRARCPDAQVVGPTYLENWQLTLPFFANIEYKATEKTPALIWDISSSDERKLDRYEGFPELYHKREVLITVNKIKTTAMVYRMTDSYKKATKKARNGYVSDILKGYEDAGFDQSDFKPM